MCALAVSARWHQPEAAKTLLLLGAPVTANDLKRYHNAAGDTRQLRADLQAWAADALVQHYTFRASFLFGVSVGARTLLTPTSTRQTRRRCERVDGNSLGVLAGKDGPLAHIAGFAGIVMGLELGRVRALGPAIAAVDWAAVDEEWEDFGDDSEEEDWDWER